MRLIWLGGVAVWVSEPKKLGEVLQQLLTEPERLQNMRERARAMKRPNAAHSIGAVLIDALEQRSDEEA